MKHFGLKYYINVLFLTLFTTYGFAQTNPTAQTIPFSFSSQTTSVLPAGIALHNFGTTSTAIPLTRTTIPGTGDLLAVATNATSGGWSPQNADGIGILASGSQAAGAMIVAINTLSKSNITVQWSVKTVLQQSSRDNSIALQYRIGTSGNYIDVGTSSTFSSSGTVVGNAQSFSEVLPAAAENQPVVQVRWVYWESAGTAGSRDRLAVGNISIVQGCTPPTNQPTGLVLTPSFTSITGSFTAAAPGTTPADKYLLIISTSPSLTVQPSSGTAYAIDDIIGNGTVVSIDNSTSFVVSNLNPSTNYYFYVYSYTTNLTCYNTAAPLAGGTSTTTPPACTPPTVQATALTVSSVTGSSMTLNFVRGNGDNILIVSRPNSSVNQNPISGVSYAAGAQIGSGNTVIYNGPSASFNYTGLNQNTTYYFALYEYFTANNCYNLTPLTGNFTTSCVTPVNVSSLNGSAGNTTANLTWSNPTASCFDEVLVVASNASITGGGSTFAGPGNPAYTGPNQVVFRGIGTNVTVTGLTNGTMYYFKVFTRNAGVYSSGVQITVSPFNPASGFLYLYGNLHSHSSYSDGNKDNTALKPSDDYQFARDANCMDFLGISEHNHSGAGMHVADYPLGYNQANAINGVVGPTGNSIVTLWGMEWGVISGGGHVLVYGFNDQLIGWEAGNYNIYCAKGDYASLFNLVNGQPDAFATLAHPQSGDYTNIAGSAYNATQDNAIYGVAVESGPAFSTSITYNDFPSSLGFLGYYKSMLAKGYHVGAQMDGDNHYLTFGRQSTNRMVVLASSKSRADVTSAIRAMRFYASNDCNVHVDYKCFSSVMGSQLTHAGVPSITIDITDADAGETVSTVELWGGLVGSSVPSAPIKTFSGSSSVIFNSTDPQNVQPDNSTYYYYSIITQSTGAKTVTSPIWYTRNDAALPVTLINFNALYKKSENTTWLTWSTAQEINSKSFIIERSVDGGRSFVTIGMVNAAGSTIRTTNYEFTDLAPVSGINLYRLREVDIDNRIQYSRVVSISTGDRSINYYSIYPSPAHDFTYINSTSSIKNHIHVQLVDLEGKILKNAEGNVSVSAPFRLDINGISKGLYFITTSSDDGSHSTSKILVQ